MRRGILIVVVAAFLGVALVQDSPNDGGTIEIRTEPPQALLSISGPEGFVSMLDASGGEILRGLAAGRYLVVATAEGHAAAHAEVELGEGAEETVTISLEPVAGSQQASQQQAGQQQAGQEQSGQQESAQAAGGGQAAQSGQQGGELYSQHCAQCHGQQGGGGVGPALAGNQTMQDTQAVITQILQGGGAMPAFGNQLSDEQVAAVATHEMNSWGNSFGQVSTDQVSQVRGGGQIQQQDQQQSQQQAGQQQAQGQQTQQTQQQQAGQQQAGQQSGQGQATGGQTGQQGGQVYSQQCAQCHGQQGGGGSGPALAGNQTLQDPQAAVSQIINGGGGMPAFGNQLSDEQIAAVATHEMNSWGNSFGQVSAQQVSQARGGGQGQQQQGQQQGQQRAQQGQVSMQQAGNEVRVEITVPANAVPLTFTVQVQQAGQGQPQQTTQQMGTAQQSGQVGQAGQQQQGQTQQGQQQGQAQQGQQQSSGEGQQISFTQSQSQQGGEEYFHHCAVCHGNNLLGRASYPPVAGEEFLSEWEGRSVQELFDFVSTRMPQDRPGTLGHQTYVDLTAFLLQQYGFPVGQEALQPASANLESVQLPPPAQQQGGGGGQGQEGPPEGGEQDQQGQQNQQGEEQNQ